MLALDAGNVRLRSHPPELVKGVLPIVEHRPCRRRTGQPCVLLDQAVQPDALLGEQLMLSREPVHVDELRVDHRPQANARVKDKDLTARHSSGQVVACWPQDHERTAGHVLGCMLSDALDDSYRAAVAYGKPLAGPPGAEELAASCAIEDCVAEKVRITRIVFGRADDDPATPHPLADVVVGLAG